MQVLRCKGTKKIQIMSKEWRKIRTFAIILRKRSLYNKVKTVKKQYEEIPFYRRDGIADLHVDDGSVEHD
jgi:hypothetical protein